MRTNTAEEQRFKQERLRKEGADAKASDEIRRLAAENQRLESEIQRLTNELQRSRPAPIIFSGRENSRDDTVRAMDATLRAIRRDLRDLRTTESCNRDKYPPILLLENLRNQDRSLENYGKSPYGKKLRDLISREYKSFIDEAQVCFSKGKTIEERLNAVFVLGKKKKKTLTAMLASAAATLKGALELEGLAAAYTAESIIFGGTTIVLMGGLWLGSRKSKEFSKSIKSASEKLIEGIQDGKDNYLNEAETILRAEFGEGKNGRLTITRALRWFSTQYDQYASAHLILGHIGMRLDKPSSFDEFTLAYEDAENELLKNISLLGIINVLSSNIFIDKKEDHLKIYLEKLNKQEDMINHYIHTVSSSAREVISDVLDDGGINNDTQELLSLKNINFIKHIKGHGEFLTILFEFIKVLHEHKSSHEPADKKDARTDAKLIRCNTSVREYLGKQENVKISDPIIGQILTRIEEYIQQFRESLENNLSNNNLNNRPRFDCK